MAHEPILVVDDNPTNLKLARVLLECEGYEVRVAADAEEAVRILETCHPDIILMDVQLPGMDGLELTRRLKADPRTRDIHIIAVTSNAMRGDEARAMEAGCDGCVTKPIDTLALAQLLARTLAAP